MYIYIYIFEREKKVVEVKGPDNVPDILAVFHPQLKPSPFGHSTISHRDGTLIGTKITPTKTRKDIPASPYCQTVIKPPQWPEQTLKEMWQAEGMVDPPQSHHASTCITHVSAEASASHQNKSQE